MKPKLLILSFSNIANDARVKKQITLLKEDYEITTCGYGETPEEGITHISFPKQNTRANARLQAVFFRLRMHRVAHLLDPNVKKAKTLLKDKRFDLAIANDLESVGLAIDKVGPDFTHADIHEFYPGINDKNEAWKKIRLPYNEWVIRNHFIRAASSTTVSQTIADRYKKIYGMKTEVVHNSLPFLGLETRKAEAPIRIVHSGGAQLTRKIENMIKGVIESENNLIFDLYLVGHDTEYGRSLQKLAENSNGRVRVLPPKPYSELLNVLNTYDVGLYILPPTSTNNELAMPNKFFDFIQARLALVMGPSPEMSPLITKYGIGKVTADFSVNKLTEALDTLNPQEVSEWKKKTLHPAKELSAEKDLMVWRKAIEKLAETKTVATKGNR